MLNTFQRELVNVVEGAGIALDPNDDGQLLKAMKKMPGLLLNIIRFTSSGIYTPTAGIRYVIVEAIGGGGGGGGCPDTSLSTAAVSGGGGPGSYIRSKLSKAELGALVPISVGIGGDGCVGGNSGGNGRIRA